MKFNFYLTLTSIVFIIFSNAKNQNEEELEEIFGDLKNDENLEELLEEFFLDRDKKKDNLDLRRLYEKQSCFETMHVKDDQIVHSRQSVDNGAEFIDVKMIPSKTQEIVLHEKCMKLCCETIGCDTSLLSLKVSETGYRCYLFNCSSKCLFANHSDYSVMTQNSFINPTTQVTTKNNDAQKKDCHLYEFKCKTSLTCIPNYDVCNLFKDCEDGSDEVNCSKIEIKKATTRLKKTTTQRTTQSTTTIIKDDYQMTTTYSPMYSDDDEDEYDADNLEEILHQDLINIFKPKYNFDDDDDENKYSNNNNEKEKLKNSLDRLFTKTTIKTTPAKEVTTIKKENIITFADVTTRRLSESEGGVNDSETIVIAVILLVLGVSLTIGLFIFLVFNSKSANRRFKWPNFKYKNNVPTDAEADHLMNGMSL